MNLYIYILLIFSMLPNFLFLPSLPAVNEYFQSDYSILQFSISAYLFTSATLQIVLGPLADYFGRKNILSICFSTFILSTICCIFTENLLVFLIFRMCQATAVSGMVISRAIAADQNSDILKLKKIMGNMAIIMALVTIFAPLSGGFILNLGSWKLIFYFLLAISILLFSFNFFFFKEQKIKKNTLKGHFYEYRSLLSTSEFWIYSLLGGTSTISFFSLMIVIPYLVENIFFISITLSSLLLSLITSGFILGNITNTNFLQKMKTIDLIFYSLVIGFSGFILSLLPFFFFSKEVILIFLPFFLLGFSTGIIWPTTSSKILIINENMRASSSGLNGAIFLGFGAIASSSTGILISLFESMYPFYLITLISLLLQTILYLFLKYKIK